jgi:hypothetical protein
MAVQFTPTETFESMVNGRVNRYREGATYTLRDTPVYDHLKRLLPEWVEAGRVRIVAGGPPAARVTGKLEG